MKITEKEKRFNYENLLILGCDVSKDVLNIYAVADIGIKTISYEEEIPNKKNKILRILTKYEGIAKQHNKEGLLVVCEPTSKYHKVLMSSARQKGHKTQLVAGCHVNKMRTVESNDTGKTDIKDPRIISLLVRLGKTFDDRELGNDYEELRMLNGAYEDVSKKIVQVKTQIESIAIEIFPDWLLDADYRYKTIGRILMEEYEFNPQKIIEGGKKKLYAVIKSVSPRTQNKTIEKVWESAESSSLYFIREPVRKFYTRKFRRLLDELDRLEEEKEEYKEEMIQIYRRLPESKKLEDLPVNESMMSRLIAEIGPLKDFNNHRQILKYVGLNLQERESGKYRGKTKISKRGRSYFRKTLWLVVLGLISKKKSFLYDYYNERKERAGSGNNASVICMRFLVKVIFGVYKSEEPYDERRIFMSKQEFKKLAA